ncbi:glycosyltransferase family 61 protein [Acetobacter sp. AN02]|uniref:glycosyltransferase family 61 protein n=1 Tax=Acetobacter sp. AN02 TaxID=2894186 RepID=UPI00243412F9|nr:glycosyltransferase family 61 protein [Acetobacter sp. AN02]MDG6094983.1 glycosyltransferase family 61 protein [Acetobacter sp. AN02]
MKKNSASVGNLYGKLKGKSFSLADDVKDASSKLLTFGVAGKIDKACVAEESFWNILDNKIVIMNEDGVIMWESEDTTYSDLNRIVFFNKNKGYIKMASLLDPDSKREKILLLKTAYTIRENLHKLLENYDVVEVNSIDEALEHKDSRIFLSALTLTHLENTQEAAEILKKLCSVFSIVMLVEPSVYSRDYIKTLGYKSFHENYAENRLMSDLTMRFFTEVCVDFGTYRVDHYAMGQTYDIRASWIVPENWSHNIDMGELIARPNHALDVPVFEMSAFVLRGFNAPVFSPDADLELIESKTLQPHAKAGKYLFSGFLTSADIGTELYRTPEDRSEVLGSREIRPAETIDEPGVYDDPQRQNILQNWHRLCAPEWLNVTVSEMPDCLIGGSGFIFSGKTPVAGSEYLIPYLYTSLHQPVWEGMRKPHPARHISGVSIVGFNHLYDNYYHFLAEAMNAACLCLDVFRRSSDEKVSIITGKMNKFMREYIYTLFHEVPDVEIIELDRNEYVTCDKLLYCSQIVGRSTAQPSLVAERVPFQRTLLEKFDLTDVELPHRLIYISRQDTKARPILNEEALIEQMKNLGFEIFVATGKPLMEQVEIFREARLVVAGHGAGVSNMLFAQEGAVLLELIQGSYLNVGPMRLAQLAGVDYKSMLFFEDGDNNSWYVDVDRVVRAVSAMI